MTTSFFLCFLGRLFLGTGGAPPRVAAVVDAAAVGVAARPASAVARAIVAVFNAISDATAALDNASEDRSSRAASFRPAAAAKLAAE